VLSFGGFEMNESTESMNESMEGSNGVPECALNESTLVQIMSNGGDEPDDDNDNRIMQALLRQAANDPDQPSLDHWQHLSGFSGKAVEDAYQAGQASGRAMGVYASVVLWGFWAVISVNLGNATAASVMMGVDFPIFTVLLIIGLATLTIKLLQEWKPVKHRKLLFLSCCALAAMTCLTLFVAFYWLVTSEGHAVSRPDLVLWTINALMGPFIMIILLRPAACLISATCTLGAALFGALGYYSDTFDTYPLLCSVLAGITFTVTMHMMWFILESTSRTSFVHQLSAVTESVAAAHAKSEQEKEKAKALEQQKAYQKMVAATAHDLRTASSALQSGCRVLTALHAAAVGKDPGLREDRAKEMNVVQMMSAMAKTSNIFLEGMALSAGLLDGLSVPIFMERVNLQQVAEEVIACGKLACSSTGKMEYAVSIDPEIGETVYCDLNCVSRNLMNLVSNAAKHTAQGSITVHMSLVKQQRTYIELAVRDTGVGVADEFKEPVFEPFVSRDDSTGLGLFVVRMQSEALGGSCGIRDNPVGPGAEVWFRVPYITSEHDRGELGPNYQLRDHLFDPQGGINIFGAVGDNATIELRGGEESTNNEGCDAANEGPRHHNVGNTHEDGGGMGESTAATAAQQSILLIDDNFSLLQVHAAELNQAGYTVTTALGGIQGLEFLKLNFYSLVLVDIKMPALNGDELVAAFRHWENHNRSDTQHQTIYALSAYTHDHDVQDKCKVVGMEGVLAKPLLIEVIIELLLQAAQGENLP